MKEQEKNIDKILKSKLNGFEVKDNPALRIRFFWFMHRKRLVGVLAGLIVLGLLAFLFIPSASNNSNQENRNSFATRNHGTVADPSEINKPSFEHNEKSSENNEANKHQPNNKEFVEETFATVKKSSNNELKGHKQEASVVLVSHPEDILHQMLSIQHTLAWKKFSNKISTRDSSILLDYYFPPSDREEKFSLTIGAGPVYDISYTKMNKEYPDTYYTKSFQEPGFKFGLGAEMRIWNFYARTGLDFIYHQEYLKLNTFKKVVDPNGGYYDMDTVWGHIYNNPVTGEPVVLGVDSSWKDTYMNEAAAYALKNKVFYLSIPLTIGYELEHKKISCMPYLGVSFNILNNSGIKIPLAQQEGGFAVSSSGDHVRSIFTKVHLGFELSWQVKAKNSIFINAGYEQNLNSVYLDLPMEKRSRFISILFGYKIGF